MRNLTAPFRRFPDFLIIGAQKGGTSSLFRHLCQHPAVSPPLRKEIHFFDLHFAKGPLWYRSHFPFKGKQSITGEASPYYLFHPHVPKRAHDLLPHAKLLILLRNPVDRAYSHYYQEVQAGRETLSFEEAIDREKDRLKMDFEKLQADETYHSPAHQNHSYLSRGIYVDQILGWREYFPKAQILILQSEKFFKAPAFIYDQTLKFLNLPIRLLDFYPKENPGGTYPPMNPKTRKRLLEYFRPHNQKLYRWLEADLGWDS